MVKNYTAAQISLQKALISLLQKSNLTDIQVKDLCQKAHVARSTFYAYYDNTDALLAETEDWFIRQLAIKDKEITQQKNKEAENFTYFADLLQFVKQNKKLLQALLINNYDHRLVQKWKKAIKKNLLKRLKPNALSIEQELILEMVASEVISAFVFYLEHPQIKNSFIEEIIVRRLADLSKYF